MAVGLTVNGAYTFQLAVDPSVGPTITDTVTITRTGAPTAPPITWSFTKPAGGGQMTIKRNGTAIVSTSSTSSGTVTSGFSVGDIIEVTVLKTKDATVPPPGYYVEYTASLNIDEDGNPYHYEIETQSSGPASVVFSFTMSLGSTYEIDGFAEKQSFPI
jgi:hypothetical protein